MLEAAMAFEHLIKNPKAGSKAAKEVRRRRRRKERVNEESEEEGAGWKEGGEKGRMRNVEKW